MNRNNLELARGGEEEAAAFLKKGGYFILKRNYRCRLGEVDIIARDKDTLCFVEVKTRRGGRFGAGSEAVTTAKQAQISKTALVFLKENKLMDKKARFDVVEVDSSFSPHRIRLFKNAFELAERFTP